VNCVRVQALHPVVLPLSIATYNFFSMVGLFPPLELDRRGLQHHLYRDTKQATEGGGAGSDTSASPGSVSVSVSGSEDLIAERRRAKALKVMMRGEEGGG
jgi:hypothetical protein